MLVSLILTDLSNVMNNPRVVVSQVDFCHQECRLSAIDTFRMKSMLILDICQQNEG